ncbi:curli assembly protein CsgF [Parachitinimonas caeni]|uniref:Curli production assembly/transport component CsgF n=1 Tax=Parachitinimonas caeni TaxID=3031301 RepID=A0ABT7E0T9_9NEIS|nr:curli assembly protein CsgF [Parachitinimonas caeni]MDK2124943.1 curli assembly protein CsgF [Parachitinimonas caeni]
MNKLSSLPCLLLGACLSLNAQAGELVYTPVNPNFGGSPLNGSYLLGVAQAQNRFKEPITEKSQLEQFQDTLQRTLLNRIASALTSNVVDKNGKLVPGEFDTASFHLSIIDMGHGILKIITTDKTTGVSTEFEVGSP